MEKYSYIMGEDFVCLVNVSNGNSITMYASDPSYDEFVSLINEGSYEAAEEIGDVKVAVQSFINSGTTTQGMCFRITDSVVQWSWDSTEWHDFHNALANRIILMAKSKMSIVPLVNFMANLLDNPSKQSVDELYLFLESAQLPITDDGCFIAYKLVRDDYTDIYSGKFDNSVGRVLEMERNTVDDRRNNTCSTGFHFCSKGYLPHYGSPTGNTRCVLVKINPADVVSIPSDYNNAKGRCCSYVVVGEYSDWKSNVDYTNSPVVASGDPWSEYVVDYPDAIEEAVLTSYFYDDEFDVFRDRRFGDSYSDSELAEIFDCAESTISKIRGEQYE